MNFRKKIALLIIGASVLRLLVAGFLELGNDEVYYQTYAQHLQWNYFDHPPMVALLIRIFTFNLYFKGELFIRLGAVICAAIGTYLIFKIGSRIKSEYVGWIAAILYTTSFYSSVIAGIFILPDSPQVVFWLLAMYSMICIIDDNKTPKRRLNIYFITLGLSTGLAIMCKIHGIFLMVGFGLFILFHRRDLLILPMLWISLLITIIIISPIFFWNLANHFVTYTYHQGRIGFFVSHFDRDRPLQQVFGSLFYSNPVNFIIYILSLYAFAKYRVKEPPKAYVLLLWLSLPLIIILLITSVFNETLPHWSGPAYFSMMLIGACWLEQRTEFNRRRFLRTSQWVFIIVLVLGSLSIRFLPLRIGNDKSNYLGKGDITLDMSGWKDFAIRFDSLYKTDIDSHKIKPDAVIITDYWFPAGHLDHYIAVPFHHNLLAFGNLNNIHQFAWLNYSRPRINRGSDAYFIYPTNEYGPPDRKIRNKFSSVEDSVLLPQYRSGAHVRNFVIYRMHGFEGDSSDYLVPGLK